MYQHILFDLDGTLTDPKVGDYKLGCTCAEILWDRGGES